MKNDFKNAANDNRPKTNPELERIMPQVQDLAREAGAILMSYYGKNYSVEIKDDDSPVTVADTESSIFLVRGLEQLTHHPVVSEENDFDPEQDGISTYWTIDPLDGTKEFIDQTGGFCVKIALIETYGPNAPQAPGVARPTLGVVYCPAQDVLYASIEGGESFKTKRSGNIDVLSAREAPVKGRLKTLFNQKHADPAEYKRYREIFAEHGVSIPARPATKAGLPRNLRVAEGLYDIHLGTGYAKGPARGSGFIWDVAADHLILGNAGGGMVNLKDGTPISYANARARMPGYLTHGDPNLARKIFP